MNKFLTFISALFLSFGAFANPTVIDQNQIDSEFKALNKIENYVDQNQGTSLEDLKASNSDLITGVNLAESNSALTVAGDLPANIPAFWWGCVLSWVGLILVYVLTDKDGAQTKKALLGCLVGAAVWIVYYLVVVGTVFSRI
jgi:hypothetical protein